MSSLELWGGSLGKPHGVGELPQKLETGPGNTAQTTKVEGRPHKLCLSHKSSPQTAAVWASNHACWEIETEIIPEPQKFAMGWHCGQRARHTQKQKSPTGYCCTFWVWSTLWRMDTRANLVEYGQYLQGVLLGKISLYRSWSITKSLFLLPVKLT